VQEKKIDLWSDLGQPVTRFITTNGYVKNNGEAVMGRGCAAEARERFPDIARLLGGYLHHHGNHCFMLLDEPDLGYVVSFPVKRHWRLKAHPEIIKRSAEEAVELMNLHARFLGDAALLPRPGCGNGGLDWETQVKPVIEPILDDRFTIVYF
jgi:hypothetical protein